MSLVPRATLKRGKCRVSHIRIGFLFTPDWLTEKDAFLLIGLLQHYYNQTTEKLCHPKQTVENWKEVLLVPVIVQLNFQQVVSLFLPRMQRIKTSSFTYQTELSIASEPSTSTERRLDKSYPNISRFANHVEASSQ